MFERVFSSDIGSLGAFGVEESVMSDSDLFTKMFDNSSGGGFHHKSCDRSYIPFLK